MKIEEIKIDALMNENIESSVGLDERHIKVQILRIITPNDGKTGNAMVRYQRGLQQKPMTYIRTLLCRSGSTLCFIMISNDMNKRLYHRDLLLRDNGTITVGSFLRILALLPIKRNMNEIPMLHSFYPAIVMEPPEELKPIFIHSYIDGNKAGCTVLNGAYLKFTRTTTIETTCTGKYCDKQRPLE